MKPKTNSNVVHLNPNESLANPPLTDSHEDQEKKYEPHWTPAQRRRADKYDEHCRRQKENDAVLGRMGALNCTIIGRENERDELLKLFTRARKNKVTRYLAKALHLHTEVVEMQQELAELEKIVRYE